MEEQKALLVIGITLIVVILFNLAIYKAVKRRNDQPGEIELFRRALTRARDPWGDEKANREALSKMVAELQSQEGTESVKDDQ